MNYTLTVYVGNLEYKRFTLRASQKAGNALINGSEKAMALFTKKITELVDTYSWTHAVYAIGDVANVIRPR